MKLEKNWRYKTIEHLEKVKWPCHEFNSFLVNRMQELRKIPLNKFTTEDLRIMIGQEIGLYYLIPLALEKLTDNLWAEGDFLKVTS
ncbi:contact-dependent growth inhibition system immunity protein [Mucilaginibacter sp.]|uniref:contact-dependent growth inhibition system immunity protein n=1 Tax=Mucilaginibacter sp. TaxID=1882438 RepID=UPI00283C4357|nr:contact-dependent growth inhibition system immunity protein [Mucilaginibacter sp.]MDR3693980.1 contact-dependent growth inhibition system immunity protein [Mucilaginibacter sp.]